MSFNDDSTGLMEPPQPDASQAPAAEQPVNIQEPVDSVSQPRLLPPPAERTEQPHSGRDAAIDIDAFYSRQTPEVRAIMDAGFQTNPPIMKKRLADVLYMAEQTGIPAQHILYNFDQIRDGFAAQQGWTDVNGDDDVMHGHIVKKATAERDHDVSLHGMEGDNATARTAREQSMQNRGYMAGVGTLGAKGGGVKYDAFGNPEDINPADAQPGSSSFDEDPLKAFERSEKNHPKLDQSPRARAERWHVFFGAYAQGNQDLTVAKAAAHEAYPYFEEGGDISKALPILRNLTPQQLTLAVREMGRGADQKPADDREALGKGIDAAGRAAAMLGRGIARFMQAGEQAGLGFVAGQTVDAEALAKGPQALVDNELERSHMNTGGFGAGAMPINPRNPVALTKEQAAEANKYVEGIKKDRNLLEQMQKIADGTVNPINADSVLQRMAITIGESLPVMGTAMIPVIGPVAVGAAFASDATENLISQGVSRNTAEGLGVVIGGIQAFGAVFTPKAFIKIPWLNNIFGNFSTSAVIRGIQRVGLGSAEGAAVATLANVTGPQLVQKIAHEFDPAVPTWSFGEIAKESWNSTSSAIIDFAPIVFLGAGFAHVSDMRAAKEIAQDRVKMTALGFDPKDVEAVMAAQDNNSAKDALMKGYARRKPILPGDSRAASLKESAERVKNMRPEDFPPGEAVPAEINQVDAEARARAAAQEAGISVHMDEDGWHVGEAGKEPTNVGDDAKGALVARDALTAEKQAEENEAFGKEMDKAEKEQREPSDEEFNKSVKALTEGGEKPNEEKENATGQTEEVPGEEIAPMHQQGREVPEIGLAAPEAVKEGESVAREIGKQGPSEPAAREGSESAGASPKTAGDSKSQVSREGEAPTAESGNRGNTTHAELEATAKEFGVELPKGEEKWKVRDEMAKAKAIVEANPRAGEDLLAELKKKPRPVDKTERFIINHEGMKREAALAEAAAKMNDDNLPESEREAAKARFEIADERWQEFHDYVARAGSLAGSSMGAIRFAQSKDFTLAGIRSYVRAKFNNGKKFEGKRGKEMEAKIKELHDELTRTSQKVAEYEAKEKAEAEKKEAEADAAVRPQATRDEVADRARKAKASVNRKKKAADAAAREKQFEEDLATVRASIGRTSFLGLGSMGKEEIAAITRIIGYHIRQGIEKISELVQKLRGHGVDLTEEEVRSLMPEAWRESGKEMPAGERAAPEYKGVVARDTKTSPKREDETWDEHFRRLDAEKAEKAGVKEGEFAIVKDVGENWTILAPGEDRNGSTFSAPDEASAKVKAMEMIAGTDQKLGGEKFGITAYQGSPHDFDDPSMERVGSGEGNQNQGHGLYYADSESVGKWYREMTGSEEKPGNLYKVHIAANHDEFLNLDLAIRDQSPEIQKAAEAAGLLSYSPPTKEQAKILSDHGVPGVRYPNFDGAGHNYVVFDESLVRHLEKNGEPVTPTTEGVRRMQIAIEKFKAIKEGAWQDLKNAGKVDASGRMFSGAEKLPEMIWHAARFAVGVAGEYGLKGAELAARVIEELGELGGWAKEHIKGIMDLAESMRHQEASDELIKSVGEKTAKEEDAQRREEIKTQRAEKKVQRDKEKADIAAIKDAGKRAAKEEDFVRRVQKEDDLAEQQDREEAEKAAKFQKDLEDKAAKIASDELIKEVGDEIGEPKDFARRVAAEAAKRDKELENFQKAVDKRVKDLRERMAKEDFSPKKRKTFEDPEKAKILADYNGAVLEYERAKKKWEMENRSTQQKIFDAVGDWKTSAVLAGAPVIVKLSAAASTMIVVTPAENLIGGAIGLLPGIRQVALKAPRHGRFSYSAEAHAIAETWRNFFKDVNDIRKKGKTEYELLYENGEKVTVGKGLGEYLSRLHAILKSPAKRNEFARSFAYRVEYYSRQGVTDKEMASKEWQMRIGTESLKDAKHQLLMNDNVFTDKWRQFWSGIEKHAQNLEKEGTIGSVGAAMIRVSTLAAKWETPIVRIPSNLVARICEYAFGSIPGAARLGMALWKGVENLPPEQADLVMRNLKRGSVGLALMIIAYHNPQMFGGYFQRGQYPDENDPDFGEMTIGGYRLPKTLMHHPLLQVMQFAATMRKISDEPEHRHGEETKGDISGLKGAMLGLMEEIPFANEVKHLAEAMDEHDKHSFWGETLKSAIPQVIQQVAGWMDPTKKGFLNENAQKERSGKPVTRAPRGIWETINSGIPTIPGLRNVLPGRNAIPTTEDRKHMPRR